MHSIAVAGHLCLDLAPSLASRPRLEPGQLLEVGPLSISLGGAVANTGRALADLGATVTAFATVGDDPLGGLMRTELATQGLASHRLGVSRHRSTSYSVVVESPGADRTFWHHTGANDEFDGSLVDITDQDLLHVGYPSLLPGLLPDGAGPLRRLLSRARAAGTTTSLDLAVVDTTSAIGRLDWSSMLAGAFAQCDIATPSLDDLTSALRIDEEYSPELIDALTGRMLEEGVAVAVISAGRHGLHLRTGSATRLRAGGRILSPLADSWAEKSLSAPPMWRKGPVTTNGAGDASTAGLLFALSRGASPHVALALAAASAAAVVGGERPVASVITSLDPTLATLFPAR